MTHRAFWSCLATLLLSGCAHTATAVATTAEPAPLPTRAPQPEPTPDVDLPPGCHRAPTPGGLPAFDCDDGSFTLERHGPEDDVEARLERGWHNAAAMLEMVGAAIGPSERRSCLIEDTPTACVRLPATLPDGTAVQSWLAVGSVGDAVLAVECTDLRGGDSLHPVCAPWLNVLPGEGAAYP